MSNIPEIRLESNKREVISFNGGDLSSDSGLLMVKEFMEKIGLESVLNKNFKTNDKAKFRIHTDVKNLLQMLFQILGAYFEDDCADELRAEPVLTAILRKGSLASQPTLSRFVNRMDKDTLNQFNTIGAKLRKIIYSIYLPQMVLFDLDTTLLPTYGKQEGEGYNVHYAAHGYHARLCFDGLTRDLLRAELNDGTDYCSKGVADFMEPLIREYTENYPSIHLFARGDSGFATPELYELYEKNDVGYAIRLKNNPVLVRLAEEGEQALRFATRDNTVDYAVVHGDFYYKAGSWSKARRVVFKIEKPEGQFAYLYTFIVTNMSLPSENVIDFYFNRGTMENFIEECKNGFDFASVSSKEKVVNANRLLVYNLFNWFRRLVLPEKMRHHLIDTIRLKLFKVAARVVRSGRYTWFKLCSSCPYKDEIASVFSNIRNLTIPQE